MSLLTPSPQKNSRQKKAGKNKHSISTAIEQGTLMGVRDYVETMHQLGVFIYYLAYPTQHLAPRRWMNCIKHSRESVIPRQKKYMLTSFMNGNG